MAAPREPATAAPLPAEAPAPLQAARPAASEPLFAIDTRGEKIGVVGMLLLLLGTILPWGGAALAEWGPLSLSAHAIVPMTIAFLALLQVASTAGLTGNVVMLGGASLVGLGAVVAKAGGNLATHDPWGAGMTLTALGALVGLAAMEVQRREAGLTYDGMARGALTLALQPRAQLALLKLVTPFAIAGAAAFFILEVYGQAVANKLAATFVLYWFNPLGKEVGIPFALDGTVAPPAIDPALAWGFIVLIDVITCLFFVWNYDHILRTPYFGRFFAWVERKGNATVVKRPWIRRLAFFGLTLYATLPLEGTGAIGGSVVGRAIGLDPVRTFLAVGLGSVIRTSLTTLLVLGAFQALGL